MNISDKKPSSNISITEQGKIEYMFNHCGVTNTLVAIILCIITTLIFSYFFFIGTATAVFSTELSLVGKFISGISLIILLVNIYLITRFVFVLKHKTRFNIYISLLEGESLPFFIKDLALRSKQKEAIVIKDLKWAVKQKLIPQGHFNHNYHVFMLSDKSYESYMKNPEKYDHNFQKQLEKKYQIKSL